MAKEDSTSVDEREDSTSNHVFDMAKVSVDEREDSTSNHVFDMAKVSVDEREDSTSNHVFDMAKVSVDEREDSTSNHVFDMAKVSVDNDVHQEESPLNNIKTLSTVSDTLADSFRPIHSNAHTNRLRSLLGMRGGYLERNIERIQKFQKRSNSKKFREKNNHVAIITRRAIANNITIGISPVCEVVYKCTEVCDKVKGRCIKICIPVKKCSLPIGDAH